MLNYGNRKWNKSLPKREREMEINCEIWGVLLRGVMVGGCNGVWEQQWEDLQEELDGESQGYGWGQDYQFGLWREHHVLD